MIPLEEEMKIMIIKGTIMIDHLGEGSSGKIETDRKMNLKLIDPMEEGEEAEVEVEEKTGEMSLENNLSREIIA